MVPNQVRLPSGPEYVVAGTTPDLRQQVGSHPEPQPVVQGPVLEGKLYLRESQINAGRFAVQFSASTNTYGYCGDFQVRFEAQSVREALELLPAYAGQYLRK